MLISAHQCPSGLISAHQWPSVLISGHQWRSVALPIRSHLSLLRELLLLLLEQALHLDTLMLEDVLGGAPVFLRTLGARGGRGGTRGGMLEHLLGRGGAPW